MALDDLGEALDAVRPDADGLVRARTDDRVAVGRRADTVHGTLVSNESEWPHHRFEIPHHDCPVKRARNHLAQVRIEASRCNSIFMPSETSLESGVGDLTLGTGRDRLSH